jgi:hypothetical protein
MLTGYQTHRWTASQAANEFSAYLHERWKGQSLVPQGQQIEQLNFSHDLYGADMVYRAENGE